MAYTQDQLTQIENAIIALGAGQRAVEVRFGDQLVRYSDADVGQLRKLRDQIQAEILNATGRRRRVFLTRHSRGL